MVVSKDGLDWVAECVAHEWFVYASDQPLAYELAAGHVCMEHPRQLPDGFWHDWWLGADL